ncbi:MAG: hypothetical protein PWQ44_471 [Methanolobus sp.]|nr:hypothetical protein [Methanolobus sp.]
MIVISTRCNMQITGDLIIMDFSFICTFLKCESIKNVRRNSILVVIKIIVAKKWSKKL